MFLNKTTCEHFYVHIYVLTNNQLSQQITGIICYTHDIAYYCIIISKLMFYFVAFDKAVRDCASV